MGRWQRAFLNRISQAAARLGGFDGVQPTTWAIPSLIVRKPGTPIIFVQAGDFMKKDAKRFLDIALRQAALASPDSDVILLTDTKRPNLPEIVQIPLTNSRAARRFKEIYRHASGNYYQYELFCFTRWFYLQEFMRQNNIKRCCVFDTDIMLFSPVEHFVAAFGNHPAGSWSWANVISDDNVLAAICGHFERTFQDRQLFAAIKEKYRNVSDMAALSHFAEGNPRILDQGNLPAMGFDNDIGASHGELYAMKDGIKLLTVDRNGVPRGRRTDGVEVPFHFLHFRGPAKRLMADFAWSASPEAA